VCHSSKQKRYKNSHDDRVIVYCFKSTKKLNFVCIVIFVKTKFYTIHQCIVYPTVFRVAIRLALKPRARRLFASDESLLEPTLQQLA
jgi:phosphoribulokinase